MCPGFTRVLAREKRLENLLDKCKSAELSCANEVLRCHLRIGPRDFKKNGHIPP